MTILDVLEQAINRKASDVHITVASPIIIRVNGELMHLNEEKLKPEDTNELVTQMMSTSQLAKLKELGEFDFSYSNPGLGRFRVNVYRQRGTYSAAIRVVALTIPSMHDLSLPPIMKTLTEKRRGLILVTGPTGSGKSTTLAAMIDTINQTRHEHIITVEDPIEYLHKHSGSMVNQREIGQDSHSFSNALRSALRQDPDVILVGEMRDLETISTAITAAETGHLVFSTLHTIGAAKTIDRVIDVFPPHQQQQIRVQLASVLEAVVSQQLLPKANGLGRVVALEIMVATPAIRNLIREGKTHQIQTVIQTGSKMGMQTMDASLLELYRTRTIDELTLKKFAVESEHVAKQLGLY
ncbi:MULTISPECIES: type IV pilus twitching motility protein PilT [unclassified Fusibacter]|uniref:type IV pilus twitching motility protein PilT n=1 Tax=unclassified Fusibacter TaxID=2624464 RepID=UPI001010D295|nr:MULTISPECIES: type IV pilus twitching motility protein PilT [unclassified Fusibacter]MCK8058906.1 type IV pilus twitching motility protein PilT [Fusibacter sp. A2]NPE21981.1 type IV pilus twitching motility protein PilT [Fusibacter sp. A1]RXV61548.1 type IV pilus twitching motility protein PilT [Fusibacter sp. A1]